MEEYILEENEEAIEVPLEVDEGASSEIEQAGITSAMVALDQGRNPEEAFNTVTASNEVEGVKYASEQETKDSRMKQMEVGVEVLPADQVLSNAVEFNDDMQGKNGILGPYIQKIKSMPSSVGKSREALEELAFLTYHREQMSQFIPESTGETVEDFFGVLIPKRTGESAVDLAVSMGFIDDSFTDKSKVFLDPFQLFNKMHNVSLSLESPEAKAKYMQEVSKHLDKASDNNFIKSEILSFIFSRKGSTDVDEFFDVVDTAAIAEAPVLAAVAAKGVIRAGSALNTLRKSQAYDSTAELIRMADNNPALGDAAGATQADIGDVLNPLINEDVSELLTGADVDQAAQITHMLNLQDARFAEATKAEFREGVLDQEDANRVMRAAEIEEMKKPGVTEAKVSFSDETGFTLEYKTNHMDEFGVETEKTAARQVNFTISDRGLIDEDLTKSFGSWLRTDPNNRMTGKLRNWFVSTVERLSRQQSKTMFNFDAMMGDAFKGLNKKGAYKVDNTLMKGSDEGVEFDYDTLKTRFQLTDKEAKAYIGTRNVIKHMYSLKNKQIADTYTAQGIKLVDSFDGVVPAKVADTPEKALSMWKTLPSDSRHINVSEGDLKIGSAVVKLLRLDNKADLTPAMVEEAYKNGYRLAKSASNAGLFRRGDVRTQWSFVKDHSVISPKGQQVLNKIEGYMPRQRTNGFYFVKSNKKGILSGAEDFEVGETVAWTDSAKSAQAWIDSQDDPSKFKKVFDREMPADQSIHEITNTTGGMYSGARKTVELPFVGDGNAEFANSFEAIQHYINHIGRQYPASLYRLGAEQRLLDIADKLGVKGATGLHNVLHKARDKYTTWSKEYTMLEKIHDQVAFLNMVPSDTELKYAERIEKFATALDQDLLKKIPGWSKVPKFFYGKANAKAHPADIIRGVTFNHLLGLYNPSQYLVQFSGAMVSFSVSPIHFTRVLPRAMVGWTTLDNIATDPAAVKKMLAHMRKNGMSEFAEDYELWAKTGYRESVVNGNADYSSVFMKNLPYDANIAQKALANHTVFYKAGELANTRMAFATATERYKAANKLKKIDLDDAEALKEIMKDTETLRLNMSKANQATFNKGWASVPLQFQQVMTKYFSKILPKGFGGTDELNWKEKMRLTSVPAAITGMAGVPMLEWSTIKLMDMLGIDETELSPQQTQIMKNGMIGWFSNDFLDVNVDFSNRMSLAGDALDRAWEGATRGKALWEWLGPSSNIADRYYRNGQYLAEAVDLSMVRTDEIDLNTMKFMANVIADIAVDIPTLSRNIKQYNKNFLTNNKQFIKDGVYKFDLESMNDRTALFAMFSFQPSEVIEIYEADKRISDERTSVKKFGETDVAIISRVIEDYVLNPSRSEQEQRYGSILVNSILQKYGSYGGRKIMDRVWEGAKKQKDQGNLLIRQQMKAIELQQEGLDYLNVLQSRGYKAQRDQE